MLTAAGINVLAFTTIFTGCAYPTVVVSSGFSITRLFDRFADNLYIIFSKLVDVTKENSLFTLLLLEDERVGSGGMGGVRCVLAARSC